MRILPAKDDTGTAKFAREKFLIDGVNLRGIQGDGRRRTAPTLNDGGASMKKMAAFAGLFLVFLLPFAPGAAAATGFERAGEYDLVRFLASGYRDIAGINGSVTPS